MIVAGDTDHSKIIFIKISSIFLPLEDFLFFFPRFLDQVHRFKQALQVFCTQKMMR